MTAYLRGRRHLWTWLWNLALWNVHIKRFIPPPLRMSGSLAAQGSMTVKRHSDWAVLSRPSIIRAFCISQRTPALCHSAAECTDEPQKYQICPIATYLLFKHAFIFFIQCLNKLKVLLCSHYAKITVIWFNTVHLCVCVQAERRIVVVTVIFLSVPTPYNMYWLG